MKDDKKVPQLRFPEFTDAWKQRKLREVVKEFYNGKTPYRQNKAYWGGNVNWLTSGDLNRDVVTNTIEKITEEGQKASRLRIIPKGTLVIAIMGLEAAGTRGNCGILGIDTTINQACMALIANESIATKDFLFQWYKAFGNRLALKFTQGTKQQNYNEELLGNLDISYPSLKEQQQIGAFFTKLDNTITLQQRKLNSLQKLKKGLLQKMFPKNGENIPEIRFPEFSDAWKQRELGEIAERVTRRNSSLESQTPLTISAEYGLIDQNKFFGKRIAAKDLSNYYLIQKGEFAYNKSTSNDAPWGAIKRLDCYNNGALSTLYIVFKIKDNKSCYSDFLVTYYGTSLWHKGVKEIASEGARNHGLLNVSPSDFFRTKLVIPQDFEEQRKIGAFFTQLDNTITLQQRKLESLQKLKKGLLQQMFI